VTAYQSTEKRTMTKKLARLIALPIPAALRDRAAERDKHHQGSSGRATTIAMGTQGTSRT
jgi:hypothetical protein